MASYGNACHWPLLTYITVWAAGAALYRKYGKNAQSVRSTKVIQPEASVSVMFRPARSVRKRIIFGGRQKVDIKIAYDIGLRSPFFYAQKSCEISQGAFDVYMAAMNEEEVDRRTENIGFLTVFDRQEIRGVHPYISAEHLEVPDVRRESGTETMACA